MSDHYCFICGHYLADAWICNNKNKKSYVGDYISKNIFSRTSVESEEPVEYKYIGEDILYHKECFDVLDKKCKYKLSWNDVSEFREEPNCHQLVEYNGIERPKDVSTIKREHKWNEEQIIEEWKPVIDQIKEKNTEKKKEKKEVLQLKRELRREQLRRQKDKLSDKIQTQKTKFEKIQTTLENEQKQLDTKQNTIDSIKGDTKRTKAASAIKKLEEKIQKREESLEKEHSKLEQYQQDYELFVKAWF